jgi:DNA-binding NarL/FixJ family response regulator
MIRVLVVDDHWLVRHGLSLLFESAEDVTLVGEAANGLEAVEKTRALMPDVVLMDLSMPVMDGVEATRRIVTNHPAIKVVALSSFAERRTVLEAIDAGAAGYLLKDGDMDDILRAVRAANQGESPLAPRAAQALLSARPARQLPALSTREREVVDLVISGLRNREIADRMGITEKTVKTHLTHVYQRLGVSTRREMIDAFRSAPS